MLPRPLVAEVRRLDEPQLRQLLILARGLLLDSEVPVVEIDDVPGMPTVRYRQRSVACGKPTCSACPHGPYWYAHWTEDGRRRSQYIGSELPAAVRRKLEVLDAEAAARSVARHDVPGHGAPVGQVDVGQTDGGQLEGEQVAVPMRAAGAGASPRPGRGRRLRLVDADR